MNFTDPSNILEWIVYLANEYKLMFLEGLWTTLYIAVIGTFFGFILGYLVGMVQDIKINKQDNIVKRIVMRAVKIVCVVYVEIFRGTPMIVQGMIVYYGMLQADIKISPAFAGILVVVLNTGAYMAEIVRGGIISIDKGQFEGASAVGMTHSQTMLHVILPQVIRNILPSVSNEFVINIKDTSVLNVIGVTELYYFAGVIKRQNFQTFQTYLVVCVIYFILTFSVTRLLRFVEKKLDGDANYTVFGSQSDPNAEIHIKKEEPVND